MAGTKDFTSAGYALPADKPVTVVLMRPDVQVGLLTTGGVPEVNADWTAAATKNLQKALEQNQKARGIELRVLDAQSGEAAQLVGDYEALHRAVAAAVLTHKVAGAKLPTKKNQFDWTLGSGVQRISDLSGGNYALFLYSRDHFASAGRQAMQAAGLLGCLVGFCVIASGGQHIGYASLVELSTGNVVWFNMLRGSQGDVREAPGAQSMVDVLMASMPSKPGEGTAAVSGKKARKG
jgi:hypothetical protein